MLAANNPPLPASQQNNHHARRIASPFPPAHRMRFDAMSDAGASAVSASATDKMGPDVADAVGEDHPRLAESKDRFARTSQRIESLFRGVKRPLFDEPADGGDGGPAAANHHA